jgi:predicted DNA-binding transcriptional regulator YafY
MTALSTTVVGMRTERLVAILLMLQRREQVTAAEVAKELEVSERTARRDLDALAMSGIPSTRSRVEEAARPCRLSLVAQDNRIGREVRIQSMPTRR